MGGCDETSSAEVELQALIAGLNCLATSYGARPGHVLLRLDAASVLEGFFQHMRDWEARNWYGSKKGGAGRKGKRRRPLRHAQLWMEILAVERTLKLLGFSFEGERVKAHSKDPGNELVDEIAGLSRRFVEGLGPRASC